MRHQVLIGISWIGLGLNAEAAAQPRPDSPPPPMNPTPSAPQAPVPQDPPPAPPLARPVSLQQFQPERVRAGLFLFGDLGLAGHASSREAGTISGSGVAVRLAAGGMVRPHLALFGGLSYFESAGVTLEQDRMTLDADDFSLTMSSFFGGLRAYSDSSFYLESTLGSIKQGVKDEVSGEGGTSKTGWIVHVGAGKEWALSSGLAIAVGVRLGGGSVPASDEGDDPTVGHFALSLALGFAGGE